MESGNYNMGFIGGGLLYLESVKIAQSYAALGNWLTVQEEVLNSNMLQARKQNSGKRIVREVVSRLKSLTPDELRLFLDGSRQEQVHLLWLAVCKRYKYVYEFAVEVLREKFLRLDLSITSEDCDVFFQHKAEWNEELARLSTTTRNKVKQILMRLLREAGFLSKQNTIDLALLSGRFIKVVYRNSKQYLSIFPVSDSDVRALAK